MEDQYKKKISMLETADSLFRDEVYVFVAIIRWM
jgi:hypothetical protein